MSVRMNTNLPGFKRPTLKVAPETITLGFRPQRIYAV